MMKCTFEMLKDGKVCEGSYLDTIIFQPSESSIVLDDSCIIGRTGALDAPMRSGQRSVESTGGRPTAAADASVLSTPVHNYNSIGMDKSF